MQIFCFYFSHLKYIIDIYHYPSQKIEIKDIISKRIWDWCPWQYYKMTLCPKCQTLLKLKFNIDHQYNMVSGLSDSPLIMIISSCTRHIRLTVVHCICFSNLFLLIYNQGLVPTDATRGQVWSYMYVPHISVASIWTWLVGWLCFTSHRQRGHLEMAPLFTVPCEGHEAR